MVDGNTFQNDSDAQYGLSDLMMSNCGKRLPSTSLGRLHMCFEGFCLETIYLLSVLLPLSPTYVENAL